MTKATINNVTTTYTYDANGLRQSKTTNGVTTSHIYDGQNIVMDDKAGEKQVFVRGLSPISRTVNGGSKEYYTFNTHGDTTALVNASGTILKDYTYDAFGNQKQEQSEDTNPFRYCGEYFDNETGFIYLRARYYDPSMGRFITEDPAKDGVNWFVYCGNNPVNLWDPTGTIREGQWIDGQWIENPDAWEFGEHSDTYKILKDLGERWTYVRNSGGDPSAYAYEANRVRRLAREGTPVQYAQDKIMNELHSGVKWAKSMFNEYMDANDRYLILTKRFYTPSESNAGGTDGWNYKWKSEWRVPYAKYNWNEDGTDSDMNAYTSGGWFGEGSYPKNWMPWMYFDGMFLSGADMGNLALGYIMKSMGYEPSEYHPWNDKKGDRDWNLIEYGAAMASQGR
ncbi:RHS repeat-associated core domain-containing protein [Acetivibrio sp. MSJd-27]|uniref:RHS repeat-associated core domain-containing protein n=1 Tax=Acetivibrio sp. MSJd-27 TaxID=2841523 RepID=UPI001C11B626|nr:RHS repeat-associated core domain-containing protein [Acetivibrio sp. MSJd-27]MBU5449160.1 RHS repeat-associated core domain-containing protein [Acetivibrio sp. MSJd-27]